MTEPDSVTAHRLEDDGTFPNNEELRLLLYHRAVDLPADDPAAALVARWKVGDEPG